MMKKKITRCFVMLFTLCMCVICSFNVSSAASNKIGLNKKQVSLESKQKCTLKLRGVKNKKVKWSSSNKKVATVKNGVISAKKAGRCTVIAKYAKKKYKCTVKVKQNEPVIMNENNTTNSETSNLSTTLNAEPTAAQTQDETKVAEFSNLVMEAKLNLSDKNTLTLKINNSSGTGITTGSYFVLEVFNNGKWNSVEFKANSYFEEVTHLVKDRTDYVQKIDLERYFDGLSKGRYRISKQIIIGTEQRVIRAEFAIE